MTSFSKNNNIVSLDVRPVLSGGSDPFLLIMETVKTLKEGQTLQIINTFQPLPLITKLEQSGFKSWTEQPESGIFHTFFKKDAATEKTIVPTLMEESLKFDALYKKYAYSMEYVAKQVFQGVNNFLTALVVQ